MNWLKRLPHTIFLTGAGELRACQEFKHRLLIWKADVTVFICTVQKACCYFMCFSYFLQITVYKVKVSLCNLLFLFLHIDRTSYLKCFCNIRLVLWVTNGIKTTFLDLYYSFFFKCHLSLIVDCYLRENILCIPWSGEIPLLSTWKLTSNRSNKESGKRIKCDKINILAW